MARVPFIDGEMVSAARAANDLVGATLAYWSFTGVVSVSYGATLSPATVAVNPPTAAARRAPSACRQIVAPGRGQPYAARRPCHDRLCHFFARRSGLASGRPSTARCAEPRRPCPGAGFSRGRISWRGSKDSRPANILTSIGYTASVIPPPVGWNARLMDEEAEILKRRLLFSVVRSGAGYWVVELWPDDFHRPLALFDTKKAATRYLRAIYGARSNGRASWYA